MSNSELFIGLMSGTSADGVDAALIEFNNNQLSLLDYTETPIPQSIKQSLVDLNNHNSIEFEQLCQLQKQMATLFSEASLNLINKNKIQPSDIRAIGSHGQTLYHAPEIPMTIQVGHPAFIAKATGITTVADFRVDDMALGGQGAPFAPAFHEVLFRQENSSFTVNIGGISNISFLAGSAEKTANDLVGWDTGPGNALMDELCQTNFNCQYDKDGLIAQSGQVHVRLLEQLKLHPYFAKSSPKSTGRETFNLRWVKEVVEQTKLQITAEDLLNTLTELTAVTIADQISTMAKGGESVYIVGGGAFNPYLIQRLQTHLSQQKVMSSKDININPNAVEAMMFAWLAKQRLDKQEVNLARVTGASRNAVLGGVWRA